MNIHIELANHEIRRIDDTALVHNLDNNTVVQLNGTGGMMFLQMSQLLRQGELSMDALVAAIIGQYPEMRGHEKGVEEDVMGFLKELYKMGLVKYELRNSHQ